MINRRKLLALSLGATLLSLPFTATLIAHSSPARAAERVKVVTSFSILGDMVREVGGDRVDLTTLVGPNADAHTFEPRPTHSRAVGAADIIFINGLGFEPWFARLAASAGAKGKIVTASEGVKALAFQGDEGDGHQQDPHAWQNLENGKLYVRNIAAGLASVDPDHAAEYKSRADAYSAQIESLHASIKAELDAIPADQRKVVTSHDAFGYFAAAYGIEFIAPQGVSTEGEASASDVAKIIDQIRAQGIRAVFLENIANSRLVERIAKETSARVGGTLFSDALSDPSGPAPTYVKMFEHNAHELVTALKPS
ncbi:metal ABC transporter substrate-binding protein [Rhizobium sullae]|uniref:metal ABC transporter substrate-binding protein n=1 Tax=Rhizobium sullae TaxID=50338 RepID=UPI000B35DAB2|nr:metal ABC transporter substrate-binding protein [Rhizobium sullae]